LVAPIFITFIILKLKWNNIQNGYIDRALEHKKTKAIDYHKTPLTFEKNIYFFVYFISDIITSFELSSIIILTLFKFNIAYVYTALFPLSLFYASFVHCMYRSTEFNQRYEKIREIMMGEKFYFSISPGLATLSTIACFALSVQLVEMPIISIGLLLMGVYMSYQYSYQHISSTYSLYLFQFSMKRISHFNALLSHELRLLNIAITIPRISNFTNIAVTSLAFLYATAYYSSTKRNQYIKTLSHEPSS